MESGWWLLLLMAHVAVEAADLETCSRKWVKMNDHNYYRAIRHYGECVLLGQALDPPARQKYQENIINNLRRTCSYFFDRSSLPTSAMIGIVREVARLLEGFDDETISQPKSYSWSNILKTECPTTTEISCLDEQTMTAPTTCVPLIQTTAKTLHDFDTQKHSQISSSQGYLLMVFFFFILLLILQILFIIWICFFNNCMCLQMCEPEVPGCCCENGDSTEELHDYNVYHMQEVQHDLASLSSDNLGSDSEFEALLKMNKLPTAKRTSHNKEVD